LANGPSPYLTRCQDGWQEVGPLVQFSPAERSTLRLPSFVWKGLIKMKVLLIKDVYKLGRAGDVKKVADGYGRNFLLTQKLAVLATPGAMKTAEKIRSQGEVKRTALNSELKDLADHVNGVLLTFTAKAGETGKLYGSITTQDVATAIQEQTHYEVKRQQIDMQPIREVGEFKAHVRLTIDLVPEIKIIVHREGEAEVIAEDKSEEKPRKGRGKKKAEGTPAEEAKPVGEKPAKGE
jgi:large subunit ribosomal protein L9